jgi:sigma-54-interacting transcriptional regulator
MSLAGRVYWHPWARSVGPGCLLCRGIKVSRQRFATASTATRPRLAPEWLIVRTHHPNVLITGSDATIHAVLASLRPSLQVPIYEWAPDAALPPRGSVATLLIRDVATLSLEQQRALLSWLRDAAPGRPHVVSTTALELFPLIERGTFLSELYYCLNTLRLDALPHP